MTLHKQKPLPEDIARLIAEEETIALARFRQRDFPGRLERAVAAEEAPASVRPFARRIPRWAWAATALFVTVGILAYLAIPTRGPSGAGDEAARAIFIRLPGLDGLESWAKDAALESVPSSPAAGRFAAAFAGLKADTALSDVAAVKMSPARPSPHLGLERLMEILIRDRAVEIALARMSPKFKEG